VVSRQASALEDWPRARIAADRGLSAEPTRLALLADRAAILHRIGQADEAAVAYEGALAAAPRDPRLLRPAAAAALAAGDAEKADATLSLLSPTLADVDPAVAALRVAIADASGPASDALLEAWQTVDPTNPQPIRRRIMARVRARAYAEALPFTAELAVRGAAAEARAVESGLALATGDLRRAATALDALGDPAAAQKVRARELLPRSPSAAAALLGSSADRPGQIALGHALLQDGDPSGARAAVAPVLAARPDDPDALAVEVLALRALGESEAAADALARLRWADPQLAI
jgi:tetratricopeptide (TPR) repeat protein